MSIFSKQPIAVEKPRDLRELEKSREAQRKSMKQVATEASVLDDLVRSLRGPYVNGIANNAKRDK